MWDQIKLVDATYSDLIADIKAANKHGGSNTVALVAGNSFSLVAVDNTAYGPTGLPAVATGDNLTILGEYVDWRRYAPAGNSIVDRSVDITLNGHF